MQANEGDPTNREPLHIALHKVVRGETNNTHIRCNKHKRTKHKQMKTNVPRFDAQNKVFYMH